LVILVAVALGGLTGAGFYTVRRMLPQESGTLTLPGLDGKVEILRDANGIPHIYASSTRDLFFAQGVVHAQERWWQMEFNRHTALGRISELTGKNKTSNDYDAFIRTLGWNRASVVDLNAASAESRKVMEDYAAGVNAYLSGKSGPDLAVEYSLLAVSGITIPIENWEPLHTVAWANAMAWSLGSNWSHEFELAAIYKKFGDDAEEMLKRLYPAYDYDSYPSIILEDELSAFLPEAALATASRQPLIAPGTDIARVSTTLVGGMSLEDIGDLRSEPGIGSNNWVISGDLTTTGKPLLANDPHLGIQMPSIWIQNGLHCAPVSAACPYDMVGFTFPGVPGIVVGRNARIAWGVTNAAPDTQDLYVIKVDPTNNLKYEVDGELLDMQVITEQVKIGGSTEVRDVRVRMTRWGPIITDTSVGKDEAAGDERPLALRWSAMEQPKHLFDAVLAINRASDWQSFREALKLWDAPAQNFVYADVDGNIGYQMPGLITIRANGHSGLTPVDGSTTTYNWKGFIPFEYLPTVYNPAKGYIATANEAIVPPAYYTRLAAQIGDSFGAESNYALHGRPSSAGFRGKRINTLIKATPKHSLESMGTIHGDNFNTAASVILPVALPIMATSDQVPSAITTWLGAWTDYQNHMNAGPAALFEMFWVELLTRTWADQLEYAPTNSYLLLGMTALLGEPDHVWWDDTSTPDVKENRDATIKAAYAAAYKALTARLGADHNKWTWGALHLATFRSNPLGQSGISVIENFVNAGPIPVSGGPEIVNATGYSMSAPFAVRGMPSMRLIVNLADADGGLWINATGQSGHPMAATYRDQIERWRMIQYLPLRFTRGAVDGATVNKLELVPKP
jgi:penicillin amidase